MTTLQTVLEIIGTVSTLSTLLSLLPLPSGLRLFFAHAGTTIGKFRVVEK